MHGFCGELARVSMDAFGESGWFMLNGEPYRVRRVRAGSDVFALEGPGGALAEARKPTLGRVLEVAYDRHRLTVEPASSVGNEYVVTEGLAARGAIRRRISRVGRRYEAELSAELPLPVQLFIAWLVMSGARAP